MDDTSFYCIIPARVMYDERLTCFAKLLYGQIAGLCNKYGYTWVSNETLADNNKVSNRTITSAIKELSDCEYIKIELARNKTISEHGQKWTCQRYIIIEYKGDSKNLLSQIEENCEYNNNYNNNYNTALGAVCAADTDVSSTPADSLCSDSESIHTKPLHVRHSKRRESRRMSIQDKIYDLYETLLEANSISKPLMNYSKLGKLIKNLRFSLAEDEILGAVREAFRDDFCARSGYDLAVILSKTVMNRLLANVRKRLAEDDAWRLAEERRKKEKEEQEKFAQQAIERAKDFDADAFFAKLESK